MLENLKMYNITSKYFSIFNNKPPASLAYNKGFSYMLLLFVF